MNYSLFFRQIKCLCLCILFSLQSVGFDGFATIKNPIVELTITGPTSVCLGGRATLTLNGCVGTVNWQPSNLDGQTLEIEPTQTTTYSAICSEDPTNPVNHTVTVINISAATEPQSSDPFKLCSGQGGATFYAVPKPSDCSTCTYQWIVNGQSSGTGASQSVTNIGTTTIALTVTNNGCSSTSPTNTVCIYGTTLTGSGTNPNCNASDGIINLGSLISEGHYVLTYTKDGGSPVSANFNSTSGGTHSLSGLSSGVYNISVASSGGNSCPTNPITVTLAASSDEAPIVSNATICEGEQVELKATGCLLGTITWEGQVGNPITVSPTVMTEYKAICTIGSCSGSAFATVTVIPKPTAPALVPEQKNVCPATTVDISGLITGSSALYPNATHSGTPLTAAQVDAIAISGTYYLFNVEGKCFSNGTPVTVTISTCGDCKPPLVVRASKSTVCAGEPTQLEVVSGCENGTISWTGQTGNSPIVYPTAETTYTVKCDRTDPNCSTTEVVRVSVIPTPEKPYPNPLPLEKNICPSNIVDISRFISGSNVLYARLDHSGTPLTASQASTIGVSDTYFLFNVNGTCFSEASPISVVIAPCCVKPALEATASPNLICYGEQVKLEVTGGCDGGTVSWDGQVAGNPVFVNPTINGTVYTARCKYSETCSTTKEVTVSVLNRVPKPGEDVTVKNTCPSLTVDISGLIIENTVLHRRLDHSDSPLAASEVTAIATSGIYYLFNTLKNCYSEPKIITVEITACVDCKPALIVKATPSSICIGETSRLEVVSGCENGTINWIGLTGNSPIVDPAIRTNFSVRCDRTDPNCTTSSNVTVDVSPKPDRPTDRVYTNTCPVDAINISELITENSELYADAQRSGPPLVASQVNLLRRSGFYYHFRRQGGCYSEPAEVEVDYTVCNCTIPSPSIDAIAKPCFNQDISLRATCAEGSSVIWYNSDRVEVSRQNPYQVNSGNAASKWYARCLGSCLSAENSHDITPVNPIAAPTISAPATFCGKGSTTLKTDCPAGVRWWNETRVISSALEYTILDLDRTTTYYATCQNPGTDCYSAKGSVTITINPIPSKPADVARTNICPVKFANISDLITATTALYDNNTNTGNALTVAEASNITATKTYYLYNVQNNCASQAAEVKVTIITCDDCTILNPNISAVAKPCINEEINLNASCSRGVVVWVTSTGAELARGELYKVNSGNLPSTWYAKCVDGTCVSVNNSVDVFPVEPLAAPTISSSVSFCGGGSTILSTNCPALVRWWNSTRVIATTETFETPYLTETTTYFATCQTPNSSCYGAKGSATITINPIPSKPADVPRENECPKSFANISDLITATTALYDNNAHSGVALTAEQVSNITADKTYFLFKVENGCFSEPAKVDVKIIICENCTAQKPNALYVGRPCKNNDQLMQITCSVGTPTLYATISATNPLSSFAVNSGTSPKTYYARCKVSATCESDYTEIFIDPVDPQTPQIVANPAKICGTGGAVTLSVNCPAIVNWYNAAGDVIGNTNTYNTTITQTTTFSVDCQTPASTCYNAKVSATVPVIPIPAKPDNVNIQNPCPVLTVNLATILNGSNAIYDNNMHSGNPLTGEQLVVSTTKKLYLYNVNEGCFSEPADINITITNPCNSCDITATTEPAGAGPYSICTGLGGVTFYASPNLASCPTCTYQWLNNGQNINGATGENYNVAEIGISNISVRIQKGTCSSTSTPKKVIIYGNTLTVTYIKPSCTANDGSITLASLISNGEYILSYSIDGIAQQDLYFTASSNGTYSISNLAAGTYVLTARWTGNAACTTTSITLYLNKSKAEEPIANGATICSGQTTKLEATGCTGGVLTWNGTSLSSIDVSPTINTDYTVTCTQGLCTNTKTVTVIVSPKPATPTNVERSNSCPTPTVSLIDLISATSALYTEPARTSTALTQEQVAAIATARTYYVFNVNNGCFSNAGTVNVSINICTNCTVTAPTVSSTGGPCKNSVTDLKATCSNGGIPTWYETNSPVNQLFQGSPYQVNTGTTPKTYYASCKESPTCESTLNQTTVTPVDQLPAPVIISNISNFCESGGEVTLSANCPANSNVRWYNASGVFIVQDLIYKPIVTQTTTYLAACQTPNSSCYSNKGSITITVTPKPLTPSVVNRSNACPATTVDISDLITATSALYIDAAHTTPALTKAQVQALTMGGTYYLFNIQNGCFSNAAEVNVTIKDCACVNPPILKAIASCVEKQGQIVATVSNSNLGTVQYKLDGGAWQSSGTFYPVTAGSHTVYAQFTNNPTCITSVQVNVLDCNCNTTFDVTAVCDNAGTSKISTDDLVRLNINSSGGTGTWAMTASGGGSGLSGVIGTPLTNGYLGNISALGAGNTINLTFTPNNNPNCAVLKTVKVPAACSPGCNLCFSALNTKCANGYLTFDLIVSGIGANDKWSAIRKTTGTSGPTIASGTGPTAGGGIPVSIKLSDLQNQHGFVLWVMVDGVHDCLGDQYVFIPCNTNNGCNISGSFSDVVVNAATNTFTFKVSVVGSGSPNGWIGFYNGTTISGNYGQTVTAGPFPVAGGAVGFGIIDKDNPNCIINVGPVSSKCVGDECADLPAKPTFGSLPTSICSSESVNITASCSNGGSPVWYSLSGNQILTNTGTADKTYIFRAACKVGNCIGETSEASVIVKPCAPCPNKPTNVVANVSCVNSKGQIVVTASGLNLQYSLNNGAWQSSNTFTNLADGTYTVSVRNSAFVTASCIASVSAVVKCTPICTFPTNININIVCVNNLGVVTVTATGTNLEYKIDNGLWQSSNVFNNVSQGTHTLYVKMQGCIETDVSVFKVACACVPATNTATISKSCLNGKGQITINATGTSLLYSIDGGLTFQASNVFNNLINKDYQIVIKSTTNPCLFYYPSLVNINCPPPCALPINLNVATSCINNLGIIAVTATGFNLEYKIDNGVWQPGSIFNNVALGSHTVYVRSVGCGETASKTVNIVCSCVPTIQAATVTTRCFNDKGEITITPLGSTILYSIDGGLTFQASNVFGNLPNGKYKIYIKTSINPCLYIYTQEITINCKFNCGNVPCVQTNIIKTKKAKRNN